MKALRVLAGPAARARLRERGLQPDDVRVIPAAAGGPKGLILNPLDRYLFRTWLPRSAGPVHLLGASIGAWRMACACLDDPDTALARMADDYIEQRYEHAPGRAPAPSHVSERFLATLKARFDGRESEVLSHPRHRLHVFTSRGVHALGGHGHWRTPLGYLGAYAANLVSRRALGGFLERVVFSDAREPLPVSLADLRTRQRPLSARNLCPAILASCAIPFWLAPVAQIDDAPPGPYWDGGITDYHLHLDYAAAGPGLVLYPHLQPTLVRGWLDKRLAHRHRAGAGLSNVVLLAPDEAWVASLPNGKLPDRNDFKTWLDDDARRIRAWRRAVSESERLAREFAELVERDSIDAEPLA